MQLHYKSEIAKKPLLSLQVVLLPLPSRFPLLFVAVDTPVKQILVLGSPSILTATVNSLCKICYYQEQSGLFFPYTTFLWLVKEISMQFGKDLWYQATVLAALQELVEAYVLDALKVSQCFSKEKSCAKMTI